MTDVDEEDEDPTASSQIPERRREEKLDEVTAVTWMWSKLLVRARGMNVNKCKKGGSSGASAFFIIHQ